MPPAVLPTPIEGLLLLAPRRHADGRGYLSELWKESDFAAAGIPARFRQDNLSLSGKGVLRGLHFQRGASAQAKLVTVPAGAVWDVAVDLRAASPTRGRWWAAELSGENGLAMFIPRGFAHGFLSLREGSLVLYKCDAEYDPAAEAGLRWDDPELAIDWPLANPLLSARDAALPLLRDARPFD